MNHLSQFFIDCLDPRTDRGQGFLWASFMGFIANVVVDVWRHR